jgi:uncharacterized protein (TIGR02001 family)
MQSKKVSSLVVAIMGAVPVLALPTAAQAELSGNIGVVSKYIFRGIGNENSGAAVQGGLDYSHEGGLYAGWWASSLDYTYDKDEDDDYSTNAVENNFYVGYGGEAGGLSYDIGLLQYYYLSVDDSDLTELNLSVGYGPFSLSASYLLNDGWWGNSGDIYWTAGYETVLPYDFTFGATLGYSTYDDDDAGNSKRGWTETTKDSNFRHLDLTLSHPIGETGADMSVTYIVAGKDREDTEYDDTIVLAISYAFDI